MIIDFSKFDVFSRIESYKIPFYISMFYCFSLDNINYRNNLLRQRYYQINNSNKLEKIKYKLITPKKNLLTLIDYQKKECITIQNIKQIFETLDYIGENSNNLLETLVNNSNNSNNSNNVSKELYINELYELSKLNPIIKKNLTYCFKIEEALNTGNFFLENIYNGLYHG